MAMSFTTLRAIQLAWTSHFFPGKAQTSKALHLLLCSPVTSISILDHSASLQSVLFPNANDCPRWAGWLN